MLKISDVKKIDAREKVQKMLTKSKGKLKTMRGILCQNLAGTDSAPDKFCWLRTTEKCFE